MLTRNAHDARYRHGPGRDQGGTGGTGDGHGHGAGGRGQGRGGRAARSGGASGGGRRPCGAADTPPHGGHRGFGPFGRARRGMIRAAILAALAEGPMHGYQIMQRIHELSGGVWRPSPGSVYPSLQEFEDRGLVTADDVEGRRVYALTDAGEAEVVNLGDSHGAPPWWSGEGPNAARMKLRRAVGGLGAAARQVGMSGSDEMVQQTLAILADARKRIYALLAEAD